jgi:hypothetical protein
LRALVVAIALLACGCGFVLGLPDDYAVSEENVDAPEASAPDAAPLEAAAADAARDEPAYDATPDAEDAAPDTRPTCAGACVPPAPAGWSGPIAMYAGSSAPPACPAPFASTPAFDGHADLVAPAAKCSACSCGAGTGASCGAPAVHFFGSGGCTNACAPDLRPTVGACVGFASAIASCGDSPHVSDTAAAPSGGACPPSAQSPAIAPVGWSTTARACETAAALTSNGCDGSDVCAPAAPPGFAPRMCMYKGGDVACPATYAARSVFYAGAVDTRACSACACAPPSGGACTGAQVAYFDDLACSVADGAVGGSCQTAPRKATHVRVTSGGAPTGLACQPSGGQPVGGVVASGPSTFCCLP